MRTAIYRGVLLFFGACASTSALVAQRPQQPAISEVLRRLDENLSRYDKLVPSFFCDEQASSQMNGPNDSRRTDIFSIFRIKRIIDPAGTTSLEESRDIKLVDGKPAKSQFIELPTTVDGFFEGALALVSPGQTSCIQYELQKLRPGHPTAPILLQFKTVLTPENSADCLLREESKGKALIDPVSLQIVHLELKTRHHLIIPADNMRPSVMGERVLVVDYAPVDLGGHTFWMPSTIDSQSRSGNGTFQAVDWKFHAAYTNYHKLEVSVHILPGSGERKP